MCFASADAEAAFAPRSHGASPAPWSRPRGPRGLKRILRPETTPRMSRSRRQLGTPRPGRRLRTKLDTRCKTGTPWPQWVSENSRVETRPIGGHTRVPCDPGAFISHIFQYTVSGNGTALRHRALRRVTSPWGLGGSLLGCQSPRGHHARPLWRLRTRLGPRMPRGRIQPL